MDDKSEPEELYNSSDVDYPPHIAPSFSHPDAEYYTVHIEPALLAALEPLDIHFFFTLTVLNVPTLDEVVITSPLIVVFTTTEQNFNVIKGNIESLWTRMEFPRYLVSISLACYTASAGNDIPPGHDITRAYHSHWKCGISIGWNDQTATSGAVLEDRGGEYNAITCAHLFKGRENDSVGLKVTQPSFEHYKRLYNASVQALEESIRIKRESEFNDADNFVRRLDSVRHNSPEHYQADSETATVIKSSHKVVNFSGRRCLQDYALLRLHSRLPDSTDEIHDPSPPMGYLAELNWEEEATTVGCATGVTYGIIAGVYGVLKAGGIKTARKEFWALPQAPSRSLYCFGDHRDSGSLVWTKDGEAVGIIIAGWAGMFDKLPLHAAVLLNGYWDTKNIPFFRDEEGNIDFKELMSFVVYHPISLIESLEMVLRDIGGDYQLSFP